MPQGFVAGAARVKDLEKTGESAMTGSLAKAMPHGLRGQLRPVLDSDAGVPALWIATAARMSLGRADENATPVRRS